MRTIKMLIEFNSTAGLSIYQRFTKCPFLCVHILAKKFPLAFTSIVSHLRRTSKDIIER